MLPYSILVDKRPGNMSTPALGTQNRSVTPHAVILLMYTWVYLHFRVLHAISDKLISISYVKYTILYYNRDIIRFLIVADCLEQKKK